MNSQPIISSYIHLFSMMIRILAYFCICYRTFSETESAMLAFWSIIHMAGRIQRNAPYRRKTDKYFFIAGIELKRISGVPTPSMEDDGDGGITDCY